MTRPVVILTIIVAVMTILYHLNSIDLSTAKNIPAPSAVPALVTSPLLQFHMPAKSAIAKLEVWDLKPFVPLGKMLSLKEMFKPVYALVKNGRTQYLQRSDRPNELWELQGILMDAKQPRALLYNYGLRRMKKVATGDVVDEQLTVKKISSTGVTLEAKDGKKPQYFELNLFNTQKDIYAIKQKTP
jgi:hypothetical protein